MFKLLIILTAVINLTCSQVVSPDLGDSVAFLGGLSSSELECKIKFDKDFVESNSDLQAVIEAHLAQHRAGRGDSEVAGKPSNDRNVDSEEVVEESEDPRRNLGRGRRGRGRGDATREPREDGVTKEPRDSTKEPCDGDDCHRRGRGRRSKGDSTREPCDDDEAEETTEAPLVRRNLGRGRRGRGRGDATREPREDGVTREPRDSTKEPCDGDDCHRRGRGRRSKGDSTREPCDDEGAEETSEAPLLRRNLGRGRRGRGRGDATGEPREDGVTKEPRDSTKEPCDGDDCHRRGRGRGRRSKGDSTREPCDDDEEAEETTSEAPLLRRNLGRGRRGRGRGNATREPREDGVTKEPREDGVTHEPRDSTKEPCDGDDCRRGRGRRGRGHRGKGDSTREPCEDKEAEETTSEAPLLRRNLGRGRRGRGRRGKGDSTNEPCDDDEEEAEETTSEAPLLRRNLGGGRRGRRGDATHEPREDGVTKEPRDSTKEPCDGDDCRRGRRGRGRKGDGDSTREPCDDDEEAEETTEAPLLRRNLGRGRGRGDVTQEPDATNRLLERNGQAHGRKEDVTEEPLDTESAALRKQRQRKRRRGRFIDATISDGIVDIDGVVTGEVVFGEVDEEMESVPLTLTVGGTSFSCDVELRRSGKAFSCRGVSEDDFRVRLGCAIALEDGLEN